MLSTKAHADAIKVTRNALEMAQYRRDAETQGRSGPFKVDAHQRTIEKLDLKLGMLESGVLK